MKTFVFPLSKPVYALCALLLSSGLTMTACNSPQKKASQTTNDQNATDQKTVDGATTPEQWLQSGAWQNGLSATPHPSIDAQKFQEQYTKHKARWDTAFAFMQRADLAQLADSTYPLIGKDVFAAVSSYVPVDSSAKQWEAHRNYADIQMVLTGSEKIGKSEVSQLTVSVPYSSETDNENLTGKGTFYLAQPNTFFIFFPGDAHKPGIKAQKDQNKKIKKLVIKVRVD